MNPLVLIIEDYALHAKLMADALVVAGISPVTAPTGHEGLALAKATGPELIIVDLHLPDSRGTDVIAKLRQCPDNGAVPIIAITASVDHNLEKLSVSAGANIFLRKPIRLERLRHEVRQLLSPPA